MKQNIVEYALDRVGHLILHHTPVSLRSHVMRMFYEVTDLTIEQVADSDVYVVVVKLAFDDSTFHTIDFVLGEFDGEEDYNRFMDQIAEGFGYLHFIEDGKHSHPIGRYGEVGDRDQPFYLSDLTFVHFYVNRKGVVTLGMENGEEIHLNGNVVVPSK